jgi:hypothetical protein
VVRFTPRPLYLRGKSPRYQLDRRLGGPQNQYGRRGEEKILDTTGTRTLTPLLSCPKPVAIPTALSRIYIYIYIYIYICLPNQTVNMSLHQSTSIHLTLWYNMLPQQEMNVLLLHSLQLSNTRHLQENGTQASLIQFSPSQSTSL